MMTFLLGVFVGVSVMGFIMGDLNDKSLKEISEFHKKMYDEDVSNLIQTIDILERKIEEQA